jgi:peptidoglycan-associated lipoprotein
MIRISRIAPVLALGLMTFAACPKKAPPPVTTPTPAGPTQAQLDSMARERQRQDSIARIEQARRDSIARIEQARADSLARIQAAMARTETVRRAVTAVVYFDYNSAELSQDARATLESKIPLLSGNPELKIRIAGHSDERGSDEYNLALGQRRAAAAKRYLTQRGIAANRIETVSYGEERPAVDGHDEAAWAQNRRDEFEITGGAEAIRTPSP